MSSNTNVSRNVEQPTQPPLSSEGRAIADDLIIFALSREPDRTLFLTDLKFRLKQLADDPSKTIECYLRKNQDLGDGFQACIDNIESDFVDRIKYLIWQSENR